MSDTRRAFAAIADALRSRQQPGRMPGRERADRVHGLPPVDDVMTADAVAATVVEAARIRDEGGPLLPAPDGAALAIIEAGKRRRGEL